MKNIDFQKRSLKITLVTLLVYLILVATHEGEFWPFSIYPMFSQAGNPWTRALVLDVTEEPDSLQWLVTPADQLHGTPVSLREVGVDQIDFSNFVSKTGNWTEERKQALLIMFGRENLEERQWMVTKVQGKLTGENSVSITVTPFLKLTADSVYSNPTLPEEQYLQTANRNRQ
ncbi:MAG: hypothetical protein WD355_07900 [Balneolaceae bacterium]